MNCGFEATTDFTMHVVSNILSIFEHHVHCHENFVVLTLFPFFQLPPYPQPSYPREVHRDIRVLMQNPAVKFLSRPDLFTLIQNNEVCNTLFLIETYIYTTIEIQRKCILGSDIMDKNYIFKLSYIGIVWIYL